MSKSSDFARIEFYVPNPSLKVRFENERIATNKPARLEILRDNIGGDEVLVLVEAIIEKEKGADGGLYNVVKFRRIK